MKSTIKQLFVAASAVLALSSAPGHATVITFDDAASNAAKFTQFTSYSVGGLTFSEVGGTFTYIWDASSPNSNGTNNLIHGFNGTVAITKTGGGTFDLNSLDLGISWYNSNASEGILINGSPVNITQALQTFNLGLTGVTQVDISGITNGYWLLDNVVYDAGNNVPEPTSLALLGLGLAGLAASRRRKSV